MSPAPHEGLTPTQIRLGVLANGWNPLPVAGKAPTPTDWPRYCREAPTDGEVAWWGRSHPGALSTGLALGRQAAIDIDVMSNPLLAETVRDMALNVFGATPFERVGRAPKVALIYRAGPDVASTSHKAADGSGDGVDILADGRQVVGFGRHKDTGLPYTWTGTASPLDARPDAAPIITAAQVAEFLARVETVMPLHGASGGTRTSSGKGSSEEIVRDVTGLVANGRERFLTSCVWRAANALHQAKIEITASVLTDSAWALFTDPHRGAVLDDGKWKKSHAAYKAKLTMRRLEAGKIDLGSRVEEGVGTPDVAPTYPDTSVPVDEARAALKAALQAHFAAGMGQRALRISTGTGKTRAAVEAVAEDIERRRGEGDKSATLYLVPTLALADEVAELFRQHGVDAQVFRGRAADDPDAPGVKMCHDLEAVNLALKLGATVSKACCKLKDPTVGKLLFCPFYDACSYQRQLTEEPDVWVASHEMLFTAPSGMGEIGSLVVDEGFAQGGVRIAKRGITLDEVGAEPAVGRNNFEMLNHADIAGWRGRLKNALQRQEKTGGLERRHLVEGGLDAALCGKANALEWRLFDGAAIWPGMNINARKAAARAAQAKGKISKVTAVWSAARELLEMDDEDAVSGRLVLVDVDTADGFGKTRAILTHGVKKVLQRWLKIPVLLLDATLPPVDVLRRFFPDVEIVADIEAKAPHATVRQVLGAPVSSAKLLKSDAGRNREAVRRAVLHRFVELGRPSTLVVAQKAMADWLREAGMPTTINIAHFNAIAGLDGFKDVGLLIVIGRTMPDVFEVETISGALIGLEPMRTAMPAKGARFHDRVPLALRMADGTGHPVQGYRHPDLVAEAARWQVAEAGVLQAIGRARAVNRTAENPVRIEVWNDIALPLTVDAVVTWDSLLGGYEIEMIADGIVLESPSDMATCWPKAWATAEGAKQWLKRTTRCQTPIREPLYRDMTPCGLRYQRPGERQKWRQGWFDPTVISDPRTWLEARLGTLAGFEK